MAQSEDSKHFSCSKCGNTGTILLIKAVGKKLNIKQKCPQHGERSFSIPLMEKNQYIPHFRDGVFRCHNCGKQTTVESAKPSGPWMLLKCVCPTHGKNLPPQKIWSTIYIDIIMYTDISKKKISAQKPSQPQPALSNEKKFCPNCGVPLEDPEDFCDACGSKLI